MGRLRVRWGDDGVVTATATTPRAGLATRFRGEIVRDADGVVLRGTARNRSHWFWNGVLLIPMTCCSAGLTVGAAVEGSWGLVAFGLAVLALCALGYRYLGSRGATAELRGGHLYCLADVLWEQEGTSLARRTSGCRRRRSGP